jgi:hypothetical protein
LATGEAVGWGELIFFESWRHVETQAIASSFAFFSSGSFSLVSFSSFGAFRGFALAIRSWRAKRIENAGNKKVCNTQLPKSAFEKTCQ